MATSALGGAVVTNVNLAPSIFQYPLLANQPIEKLEWVYRAEEVLRLEHNAMGDQYRSGKITEAQWNDYLLKSFDEKSKRLGYEKATIREALGYAHVGDMKATSTIVEMEREQAEKEGFRQSTRWDIKTDAIFVPNIASAAFEDFTTYTEVDPNTKIAVTSTRVTWTAMSSADSARVYKDMGAAHFDASFTHLWELSLDGATTDGTGGYGWAVANVSNLAGPGSTVDHLRVRISDEGSLWLLTWEMFSTTATQDFDSGMSYNTVYYCKTVRDEAVGTFGTLYNYVYSDSGRTTLINTETVTLHGNVDFQYLYAMTGQGSGVNSMQGFVQNFDLQEAAAMSPFNTYGSITFFE